MTGWHVDDEVLARYARGQVALSTSASVEAHLLACERCRALLAPAVELDRLEQLWDDVVDRVDAPRPGVVERLLRLARISEETARLLAAIPTLRASWLLALAVTLGFAAVASNSDERGTLIFLTVAPMLPVVGVAAAFHRSLDPTYEVGLAAPYSQFRLLLLRSVSVNAVTCVASLAVGLLLPDREVTAAAWLLPALALTSLTLVLARRFDVAYAAAGVGVAWIVAVSVSHLNVGQFAAFGAYGQLVCLIVTAASVAYLLARRDRYATRFGGV